MKEVAPNTTEPAVSRFWKHDVKVKKNDILFCPKSKCTNNIDQQMRGFRFVEGDSWRKDTWNCFIHGEKVLILLNTRA